MASFLLLLHILPPQPMKRKTPKISAAQAMDHLVVFHKVRIRPQYATELGNVAQIKRQYYKATCYLIISPSSHVGA